MRQFGISGDCLEERLDREDAKRREYLAAYPTRWRRFLRWLGIAVAQHTGTET